MMTAVNVRKTFQTHGFLYISNAEVPEAHVAPACTLTPVVSFLGQTEAKGKRSPT